MSSPPTAAPTWRRPSLTKQAAGFLAGLIGLLGAFVFLASPAGAHHPVVSGTSECAITPGNVTIDYTAESWGTIDETPDSEGDWGHFISEADIDDSAFSYKAPTPGGNQHQGHIELEYKVNGGTEWVSINDDISFTPSQYQVHGSIELPEGDFPVQLRTLTSGVWKNGSSSGANSESQTTVGLPNQDCSPDVVNPTGFSSWKCDDDVIAITLDNSGSNVPVEFDVNGTKYTVPANTTDTTSATVAGPTDGNPVTVTITAPGFSDEQTYSTADCAKDATPFASADYECHGDIAVVLKNETTTGTGSVTFTVDVDGTPTDYTIANGGDDITFDVPGPTSNASPVTVTITNDVDDTEVTETGDLADCEPRYNPSAAITDWECGDDFIVVTLDNTGSTGDGSVTYTVNGTEYEVDNGTKLVLDDVIAAPTEDGAPVTTTVTYGEQGLVEKTFSANCDQNPTAAIVDWDCDENIVVNLDNTKSPESQDFNVDGEIVTVPAGETKQVLLDPPAEDGPSKTVTVTVGEGEGTVLLAEETFTADCFPPPEVPNPGASSSWTCDDEVITVTLNNGGSNVPVTYTVNGESVTVPAFTTETVELDAPVEDGAPVTVTVMDGTTQLHTATYQATCEEPPADDPLASSSWECDDTVITVTLDNRGSEVDVIYNVNGAEITVPAGVLGSFTLPAPVEDGAPVDVVVTDGTNVLHEATYQATCEDVLDDEVTNPPPTTTPPVVQDDAVTQLPRTGSDPMDLAAPGLLILLLGAGFVLVSKELARA